MVAAIFSFRPHFFKKIVSQLFSILQLFEPKQSFCEINLGLNQTCVKSPPKLNPIEMIWNEMNKFVVLGAGREATWPARKKKWPRPWPAVQAA
ncbi:hypothetical protein BpHYR1_027084 [Brachionus plicatilis]|uniref:Uncharacterized protein n=1 Tax=Brachionus plicatilis TaxID=10195 RepID=A0A3M7R691_BRAPC|nr:hypothetical protein BpHYR1_027084 [Brachionus plicatilis]